MKPILLMAVWAVLVIGGLTPQTRATIATFDDVTEAVYGTELVNQGVRFYEGLRPYNVDYQSFSIEQADGVLSGPGFSSPNTLSLAGYLSGPNCTYVAIRQIKFALAQPAFADQAGVDVFTYVGPGKEGNALQLEAWRNGGTSPVAIDSLVPIQGYQHYALRVSDASFDYLRLAATGPIAEGSIYWLTDNVEITPEPANLMLLLSGLALALPAGRPPGRRRG